MGGTQNFCRMVPHAYRTPAARLPHTCRIDAASLPHAYHYIDAHLACAYNQSISRLYVVCSWSSLAAICESGSPWNMGCTEVDTVGISEHDEMAEMRRRAAKAAPRVGLCDAGV